MTPQFNEANLDLMFRWVVEREAVRYRKEESKQPKPWTADPILMSTRFCNVRRMDDKVSKWLLDNWYKPVPASGKVNRPWKNQQLANAGMARLINKIESLEVMRKAKLNTNYSRGKSLEVMGNILASGKGLFTGAYIINGLVGQKKEVTVADQFEELYNGVDLVDTDWMQRTHANLQSVSGIGSFMGGQIVADLRHVWPGEWNDRNTWAPLGPGSRRGIAWITSDWNGTDDLPKMKQIDFEGWLELLHAEFMRRVPKIMADRKLEMHDLQNCLCETDKYIRLTKGTGRAKNGYPGAPV